MDLGRYRCEVWAGQYWRLENQKSLYEFSGEVAPGVDEETEPIGLLHSRSMLPKPDIDPNPRSVNINAIVQKLWLRQIEI